MWSEADIARSLDGHFWTRIVSEQGTASVVNLLEPKKVEERNVKQAAEPWTDAELRLLASMKRAGHNYVFIASNLRRSYTAVSQMWAHRRRWMFRVFSTRQGEPTMREIASAVCSVWKIGQLDLLSERRTPALAEARQAFYWIAKNYTQRSYTQIGGFAKRDHSTVIHGVQKIGEQMERFKPLLEACLAELDLEFKTEKAA